MWHLASCRVTDVLWRCRRLDCGRDALSRARIRGHARPAAGDNRSMNVGQLIETHGYWILAIGCLLEGETILLLAGFAAHQGHLNPFAVLAIAAVSGFIGDQFFFWLGRRHGPAVLARWPSLARQSDRVHRLLIGRQALAIIGIRFAYGLRAAGPVLMGAMPLSAPKFALFNAIGAVLWACLIGGLGWLFGAAAERMMGELRHLEGWLLIAMAGGGLLWLWIRRRRQG